MPIFRRLKQGGPSRKVPGNFRRVEEIGEQELVEQKFRPGEFVGHLSQTFRQIRKPPVGFFFEDLFSGKILLDHQTCERGKRDLIGRRHFFQVVVGLFRNPDFDDAAAHSLPFRSFFFSFFAFSGKNRPASSGSGFFPALPL